MIGDVLRWAADRIDPPKPVVYPDYPQRGLVCAIENEQADLDRREAAMQLVEAETLGYLLVLVRDHGDYQKLEPHLAMNDGMWGPMKGALSRIATEADRVFA